MADQRSATIVMPEEGELIHAVGDRYRFLATREVTDGRYGIWEAIVPPGGGPPAHRHTREEEGFYVIEGEVTIHVDGQRVAARAGSFVNMPVGSTHWFRNESDRPARMLVLVAPGGMEDMFRQAGTPVTDPAGPIPPPSDAELQKLLATAPEFGIEIKRPAEPTASH
jgi:quercetin dioxygenase-like cupin family protein